MSIISKPSTKEYRKNWEVIWGKGNKSTGYSLRPYREIIRGVVGYGYKLVKIKQ